MQRVIEEAEYVLAVLYRTRDDAVANPTLFGPDARDRIDEAIRRTEHLLSTVSEMIKQKEIKAA